MVGGTADQQHPRGCVACSMGCHAPYERGLKSLNAGTSKMAAAGQDRGRLQDIDSLGGVGATSDHGGCTARSAAIALKPWPGVH